MDQKAWKNVLIAFRRLVERPEPIEQGMERFEARYELDEEITQPWVSRTMIPCLRTSTTIC